MSGMTREEAIYIITGLPIYRMEKEYDSKSDLMKALEMAIADMEKQIPKAIINQDEFFDYAECPSCNYPARDFLGCLYGYCRKCGQRLKVGEEND